MTSIESKEQLQNQLLPLTIQEARRNIVGYRDLYKNTGETTITLSNLDSLPILFKEELQKDLDRFRDLSLDTFLVQHTTGTTGPPLILYRSKREVEYLYEFLCEVGKKEPNDPSGVRPLCITLPNSYHGDQLPLPYHGPVFPADPNDPLWRIEGILTDPAKVTGQDSRELVLVGLESQLRILTCRLHEHGFDFSKSKLKYITTTGDLITDNNRKWYESLWGVPLIDRYSMTELIGGANWCGNCKSWHLDPLAIGEVVDAKSFKKIHSGYGVLVITNLYPFVQKQPLIRYWTGDLVEISTVPCPVDNFGFKLKGRVSKAILDTTVDPVQPLLMPADVYNILDDYPEIAKSRMFTSTSGINDYSMLGHLKFNYSLSSDGDRRTLVLALELRFGGYHYPDKVKALFSEIKDRILDCHSWLKSKVGNNELTFSITEVPLGSLSGFSPDEVE